MKKRTRWFGLALALALVAAALAVVPGDKLVVVPRVDALDGGHGKLTLTFRPDARYDFNRTPPLTVEVEPVPGVRWEQTRQVARDGKPSSGSQYFGQILPVEFKFVRERSVAVEARVKVTYFYCSKKDGYCARESKTLVVPL